MLKLIETTNADSFELFYGTIRSPVPCAFIAWCFLANTYVVHYSLAAVGLYKFNRNSMDCIVKLKEAMDDVVGKLLEEEESDAELETRKSCDVQMN